MNRYIISRYALIEEWTSAEAESAEHALELLNAGKLPSMQLLDDAAETGPVRVFEEEVRGIGPSPLPLDSVSRLAERVRILREALEGLFARGLEHRLSNFPEVAAARAAIEATKEE